jgi:pimeloyl-ACP methyl ester carboxylesterase
MRKRDIVLALGGAFGAAVVVKLLTRSGSIDWGDVESLVPLSERSRFAAVDGLRIHYQEFGDAVHPTLFLIHGYTASLYAWHSSAPVLAKKGFHVVALDLVGFGYSEKPRWFDYSIGSQARIVSRLMDRLGIGRATIVGSSYGGAVAATLALDYPARVEKLVLVSAVINDNLKNDPIFRLVSVPGIGEALTPFLADSRVFLRHRMRGTLARANHHLITDERVNNIMRPLRAADGHHSLLATSRNWHARRIERDAHRISQPTLVIWGEDDTVIPIADGYKLYDSIAGSRFVVFRDCGHVPQEEKSPAFCEIVSEFCGVPEGSRDQQNGTPFDTNET